MKLFWVNESIKQNSKLFCYSSLLLLLNACATHQIQLGKDTHTLMAEEKQDTVKNSHTLYLIGDAGNADDDQTQQTLSLLKNRLDQSGKNATLLFLGDNIYPLGMPVDKNTDERKDAEIKLENQLKTAKDFKGKTVFIPGNHDWYHGLKGLSEEELFVTDHTKDKKSFLPRKGCGIESISLTNDLSLVVIDSQWYLEDWDNQPYINDNCDIKTREKFFEEFESLLNKNQNKTTIVAIHHPLITNGPHGGQYSLKKQLYPSKFKVPLPVLGSLANLIRKTSGVSPQDTQNKLYTAFVNRLKPIIQNKENVIVVSGHEHNLQYIENDGIYQIVSGSASKKEAARAIYPVNFSYGGNGYAVLNVKENGSAQVVFYATEGTSEKEIFRQEIIKEKKEKELIYTGLTNTKVEASVYTPEMTKKSAFYRLLWGKHYREHYSRLIEAPIVKLDTLYGGLKPTISGGGHQSLSLRLKDKNGKEYVMRALKKSASRFLQSVAFKEQNIENDFDNTTAERFIYDYYTTAHPYTPFVIGDLADKIGVYHSNPKLFYVPKQTTLGHYNETFGDGLYMIEERPTDEHKDLESFGKPDGIIGSDDVLANLRKDEKYSVDEESYIKARLFDMLIGDWDRHPDQWRWAEFKQGNKVIYKPIPRDRDQAFAKIDGNLLALITNIPAARHMKSFKKELPNSKWFNFEANGLDLAFIKNNDAAMWQKQAQYIVANLTPQAIDQTFGKLPKELRNDATTTEIKTKLNNRLQQLETYGLGYRKFLNKNILLLGTDKKDKFVIERQAGGKTEITQFRVKKEGEEKIFGRVYDADETKEIVIYGLDDEDIFEVGGKGSNPIRIRLIGGQNHDTYTIDSGKNIRIYDFKSKENTITGSGNPCVTLTDDYEVNEYYSKNNKPNALMTLPSIGSNPDDGVKLGISLNYTRYGFKSNPYAQNHQFKGNYYFATEGFELFYKGTFAKTFGNWDFALDTRYTTPNFSINYFGYGNEIENNDDEAGMNYNRVKIQMLKVAPSLIRKGKNGSTIQIQPTFENIEVEETPGRFVDIPGNVNPKVFDYQQFAGIDFKYSFENYDNVSNPTMGMTFSVLASWKTNLNDQKRNFPYLEGIYGVSHKLLPKGQLVLGTLLKAKAVLNNNYEFYQGASLGGDYDLRGYRTERFLGKQSFFQSTDLRLRVGKIRQSLIPMQYGLLGGYDYGRVWLDGEDSDKWHQSVGGGLWLNGLNSVTARLTYFNGSDGSRIAFGLGFGF
ncbi:metallophosphoesterase [Flavobacterium amniphilum]|uniref:metallophosphoesterase n=1 Tax=Flavobacterium amniphilum TaxID=1834035 RepID=UPI002029C88C|nr:metallophosphoesterase [Flavobacterium amniphilum]MCL9804591.1 metallophosphoesterase [Flavobacterium amniphilum]